MSFEHVTARPLEWGPLEPHVRREPSETEKQVKEMRDKTYGRKREIVQSRLKKFGKNAAWLAALYTGSTIAGNKLFDEVRDAAVAVEVDRRPRTNPREFIDNLPEVQQMQEELEQAFGKERLRSMLPMAYTESERENADEDLPATPSFEMVTPKEERSAFQPTREDVQELASAMFPRGWVSAGAVERVQVMDKPIPMPKSYGIEGTALGACTEGRGTEPARIELSPNTVKWDGAFHGLLSHELAHANDWERSADLTYSERVTLLYLVHKHASSEQRYPFSYVESIKNNDPKEEAALKTTEYWAELMEAALKTDAETEQEWVEHMQGGVIQPMDPDTVKEHLQTIRWYFKTIGGFKPWEAVKKRKAFEKTRFEGIVEEVLTHLPSGTIKAKLLLEDQSTFMESTEEGIPAVVKGALSDYIVTRLSIQILRDSSSVTSLSDAAQDLLQKGRELGEALRRMTPADLKHLERLINKVEFKVPE